jgi:hypothetical protein
MYLLISSFFDLAKIYNAIATMAIGVPIAVVLRNFEYVVLVIEVAIVVSLPFLPSIHRSPPLFYPLPLPFL